MTKKELAVGTVIVIGAALGGYFVAEKLDGGTDDRPPIEVVEGSIDFGHGYPWADRTGTKRVWRPNQPNGKHVKHFDVVVTTNGNEAGCGSMQGKKITIAYEAFTFILDPKAHDTEKKDEPELTSPESLEVDKSGLVLSLPGTGKIRTVTVDNHQPCDVSTKPNIRIKATPKH